MVLLAETTLPSASAVQLCVQCQLFATAHTADHSATDVSSRRVARQCVALAGSLAQLADQIAALSRRPLA